MDLSLASRCYQLTADPTLCCSVLQKHSFPRFNEHPENYIDLPRCRSIQPRNSGLETRRKLRLETRLVEGERHCGQRTISLYYLTCKTQFSFYQTFKMEAALSAKRLIQPSPILAGRPGCLKGGSSD